MFYFPEDLIKKHDTSTKTAIEYEYPYSYKKTHCFQFLFSKADQETPSSVGNLYKKETTNQTTQHSEMQAIQKDALATLPWDYQ